MTSFLVHFCFSWCSAHLSLGWDTFVIFYDIEGILALIAVTVIAASETAFGVFTVVFLCIPFRESLVLMPDAYPAGYFQEQQEASQAKLQSP